ncbi:uncharacterized protein LOC103141569 isoform X1 [Poecilia formosa]|uniref:uncharacterized protein LOC103141569 isoform X1 n=2 Tax=Poecilia formosa TaxID=48698 RepID=UPI000443ED0D|nr:PREDICTED: uncharacterized protein LOC103141569 isoform X1 [Poecilia formosa]
MTSSPRNAFICVFFLTYWNACIFPGNAAAHHRRSWLGCQVLIHCQGHSADSGSFKWFYKENKHSKEIQLYFQNKNGIRHYDASRSKAEITANRSLVINNFNDKDQGDYWCENCLQETCSREPSSFITMQKEIIDEIQETFYILHGSSFTRSCPGEFVNLKWTFEASNAAQRELEPRSEMVTVTTNKTLYIGSVKNTNAGKYTCWVNRCGGPYQKPLTINLCVITVSRKGHSIFSCAATCDVGLNDLKNISSLLMSNQTISVDIDPSGSLICNSTELLDGQPTTTTNSYTVSAALNTTMGVFEKTESLMSVIYGVVAAFTFFILLAILTFCLKSRVHAAFPFRLSCCGFTREAEEESTVIYSSVIIKTPAKARSQDTDLESCIYSELKCKGNTI